MADDRQYRVKWPAGEYLVRWKAGEITPHAASEKQAKQIAIEYLLVEGSGRMEAREITGENRGREEETEQTKAQARTEAGAQRASSSGTGGARSG